APVKGCTQLESRGQDPSTSGIAPNCARTSRQPVQGESAVDPLVIVGAANDGELVVDLVEDINEAKPTFEILGFLDDDPAKHGHGRTVNGYPVLGSLGDRSRLPPTTKFVLTVASPKRTFRTKRVAHVLGLTPDRVATLVHPLATVSRSAVLGHGCVVMAG